MPELAEIQEKIEPFRSRLYNAEGMAHATRAALENSDASQDVSVGAAVGVLEELERLIAEVNEGLDAANIRKAMAVQS